MRKRAPRGSTERLDISGLGVFSADNRPGAANDGPLIWDTAIFSSKPNLTGRHARGSIRDSRDSFMDRF